MILNQKQKQFLYNNVFCDWEDFDESLLKKEWVLLDSDLEENRSIETGEQIYPYALSIEGLTFEYFSEGFIRKMFESTKKMKEKRG